MVREAGAVFVVNDHADIAAAVDADGVHLGQDDLPIEQARRILGGAKIIGISTHSPAEARDAEKAGANYIGFGTIFPTETKDTGILQGVDAIKEIRQAVSIPIVAIGGINLANARSVIAAGADGIAVISAILKAPDLRSAAAALVHIVSEESLRRK